MTTISSTNIYGANAISPVQQLLNAEKSAASVSTAAGTSSSGSTTSTNYQDQDYFITAKVAQLKSQLALYQAVPGLDPDGSIQDSITNQANQLVAKQQAKIKASQTAAAAQQAILDKQNAEAALNAKIPTVDELLARSKSRANGEAVGVYQPASATATGDDSDGKVISSDQMLANSAAKSGRGGAVNQTA